MTSREKQLSVKTLICCAI